MNGIDKITARIESDAKAEADVILAESRAECEIIRERYEKDAQDEYWRLVREGVKDCEMRVQRLGSTAAMESKKSILALKQEMVAEAFERAVKLLAGLPDNEYLAFLANQAASASRTGAEEVLLNARDSSRYGERAVKAANEKLTEKGLPGGLTLGAATRQISGGLILKDGDIEINCSAETLTELHRNDLATQVAAEMFD